LWIPLQLSPWIDVGFPLSTLKIERRWEEFAPPFPLFSAVLPDSSSLARLKFCSGTPPSFFLKYRARFLSAASSGSLRSLPLSQRQRSCSFFFPRHREKSIFCASHRWARANTFFVRDSDSLSPLSLFGNDVPLVHLEENRACSVKLVKKVFFPPSFFLPTKPLLFRLLKQGAFFLLPRRTNEALPFFPFCPL